ncbi:hypothetical protein JVU11DRAFT_8352 [Chiua virens]|nr:hypothetical protein JVU11DRAFT_8352 [Chiua virens]
MLSLWSALDIPLTRIPIDGTTLVSHVFPPVVCSFLVAVLAVTPQTRTIRFALWPVVALLALRAALSVDVSFGKPEREFLNIDMVLSMVYIGTRTLEWSLAKEPLVRYLRPAKSTPSTIMDALDLVSNLRGHGWEWARGSPIPRETRPTDRPAFLLYTLLSALAHALICGALHRAVLSLAPGGTGPVLEGSTILDDSLPLLVCYFRASFISVLCAFAIYAVLQMAYDLATIPAILFLGQDPAQWPPAFDAPWYATSLSDFWGRRWHQWFRQTFLLLGSPLSFLFGTIGRVSECSLHRRCSTTSR